jgi:hypothetical protein
MLADHRTVVAAAAAGKREFPAITGQEIPIPRLSIILTSLSRTSYPVQRHADNSPVRRSSVQIFGMAEEKESSESPPGVASRIQQTVSLVEEEKHFHKTHSESLSTARHRARPNEKH